MIIWDIPNIRGFVNSSKMSQGIDILVGAPEQRYNISVM